MRDVVEKIVCTDLNKRFVLEGKAARHLARRNPSIELKNRRAVIHAVNNLSFSVNQKEIFGLLGPNGAGKTTTVKILTTLLHPDSGEAWVNGFDVARHGWQVRKSIGVVLGAQMNYHRLTGRDNLRFYGKLYGLDDIDRRTDELADFFEFKDYIDQRVETYSWGMKCKLALIRGMIHDPEILFLDEPTLGLDPAMSLKLRSLILQTREEHDSTILLCTHYMAEAEMLCDRIGIMDRGRLVAVDSPKNLERIVTSSLRLEIETDERSVKRLSALFPEAPLEGSVMSIGLQEEREISHLLELIGRSGVPIRDVRVLRPSLEEVFVHFTNK